MSRQASSAKAGGACSFSITAQAGPARYFLAWQPCTELLSESLAGEGFALPGRVTFSLRAQRESNQRESAPRHPGLIALGRSDFPRSGAAPGPGAFARRDGLRGKRFWLFLSGPAIRRLTKVARPGGRNRPLTSSSANSSAPRR